MIDVKHFITGTCKIQANDLVSVKLSKQAFLFIEPIGSIFNDFKLILSRPPRITIRQQQPPKTFVCFYRTGFALIFWKQLSLTISHESKLNNFMM